MCELRNKSTALKYKSGSAARHRARFVLQVLKNNFSYQHKLNSTLRRSLSIARLLQAVNFPNPPHHLCFSMNTNFLLAKHQLISIISCTRLCNLASLLLTRRLFFFFLIMSQLTSSTCSQFKGSVFFVKLIRMRIFYSHYLSLWSSLSMICAARTSPELMPPVGVALLKNCCCSEWSPVTALTF